MVLLLLIRETIVVFSCHSLFPLHIDTSISQGGGVLIPLGGRMIISSLVPVERVCWCGKLRGCVSGDRMGEQVSQSVSQSVSQTVCQSV